MKNPLYPYNIINDETINNYNRCIIMTLENNLVYDIFDKDILTSSYFDDVKYNYSLKSIPMWIIKIMNQTKKFIIYDIKEDDLLKFNFDVINMQNEKIVYNLSEAIILIPTRNWNWFFEFIEPYVKDGINDMCNYIMSSNLSFSEMFSQNMYSVLKDKIITSRDVKYWSDINKCRINITTQWLMRDINFSDAKEITITQQNSMNNKCNDYLQDLINKKKYVDAGSGIKTHKYTLYHIEDQVPNFTDVMIQKLLFNLFDDTVVNILKPEINYLINNFLVSKKYCHLIIKNKNILKYVHNNFNLFSLSYSYAWLMMYIEEGILKSMIKETDRCVFTLEQAYYLPNIIHNNNVYLPMMVEKKYINIFGGFQTNSNQPISLSSMDTFRNRLIKFSNNNNIDIFKNLDWTNLAITGSVIPATCRQHDPMEIDGGYTTSNFFDTYYGDSDIDVMCDFPDQKSFIDKVNYFASVVKKNILDEFQQIKGEPIVIEIFKTGILHINKKHHGDEKITLESAYNMYCNLKNAETKYTEPEYQIINKLCTIDQFKYYIYTNDNDKPMTYGENIKYHISSPFLTRKFEIFKIKYNFLATVGRFHLPCVRGYYNGTNVYLLPSAISALLTNKCMDYKYFAGLRSPFEIILKYNFRGFSIMLNKKEMIKIVEYIKNTEKWRKLYKVDNTFNTRTFNSYYTNHLTLLNNQFIKYIDYRKPIENNLISPIISSIGYILPLKN